VKKNILIGYSGHAYVVCDIFESNGQQVDAYFENEEKISNPYELSYLGKEQDSLAINHLKEGNWFVAIGNNNLRQKILIALLKKGASHPISIFHKKSFISPKVTFGYGTMVGAGSIINPLTKIGNGVICNTGAIIEHECEIGDFVHIAPGVVLAGNVKVGNRSFIGANTIVKEGVAIGEDVVIGAGSVILKDISSGKVVVGNPSRELKIK